MSAAHTVARDRFDAVLGARRGSDRPDSPRRLYDFSGWKPEGPLARAFAEHCERAVAAYDLGRWKLFHEHWSLGCLDSVGPAECCATQVMEALDADARRELVRSDSALREHLSMYLARCAAGQHPERVAGRHEDPEFNILDGLAYHLIRARLEALWPEPSGTDGWRRARRAQQARRRRYFANLRGAPAAAAAAGLHPGATLSSRRASLRP